MFKERKNLGYFGLILIFALIFFYEKKQFDSNISEINAVENTGPTSHQNDNSKGTSSSTVSAGTPLVPAVNSVHTDSAESLQQFNVWVKSEAKTLEDRISNQEQKEVALRKVAQVLTLGEIKILQKNSGDMSVSANERIFSTYLLTLGSSATDQALKNVATMNLSLPSPQPVHSPEETLLAQQKAIRTMAIDEFFSRAKANPTLRNDFLQMAQQIQDSGLRNYALHRASEFN